LTIGFTPTNFVVKKINIPNRPSSINLEEQIFILSEYLEWICRTFSAQVVFIPHVYGPEKEQDDRIVCRAIMERCKVDDGSLELLNHLDYTAGQLKYLIGKLDLLIGCRTHTIIAALGQTVPVIAFTEPTRYKTNGIITQQFQLKDSLFDVTVWDIDSLKQKTQKIIEKRHDYVNHIKKSLPSVTQNAMKNITLLENISCREYRATVNE
jgi:polysaccharide pyruvyl transferase WcaK-like protein